MNPGSTIARGDNAQAKSAVTASAFKGWPR
jgi:hypothetical protein